MTSQAIIGVFAVMVGWSSWFCPVPQFEITGVKDLLPLGSLTAPKAEPVRDCGHLLGEAERQVLNAQCVPGERRDERSKQVQTASGMTAKGHCMLLKQSNATGALPDRSTGIHRRNSLDQFAGDDGKKETDRYPVGRSVVKV